MELPSQVASGSWPCLVIQHVQKTSDLDFFKISVKFKIWAKVVSGSCSWPSLVIHGNNVIRSFSSKIWRPADVSVLRNVRLCNCYGAICCTRCSCVAARKTIYTCKGLFSLYTLLHLLANSTAFLFNWYISVFVALGYLLRELCLLRELPCIALIIL